MQHWYHNIIVAEAPSCMGNKICCKGLDIIRVALRHSQGELPNVAYKTICGWSLLFTHLNSYRCLKGWKLTVLSVLLPMLIKSPERIAWRYTGSSSS